MFYPARDAPASRYVQTIDPEHFSGQSRPSVKAVPHKAYTQITSPETTPVNQNHPHRKGSRLFATLVAAFFLPGVLMPAQAQIPAPTALYDFGPKPDVCQGADVTHLWGPLVQGRDGNLYGASNGCGVNGSGGIYKITPEG